MKRSILLHQHSQPYTISSYLFYSTVEPPNKGHIGTKSFVLYREVSFIRRLKCTGIIGIWTSRFVLYREVLECPLSKVPLYTQSLLSLAMCICIYLCIFTLPSGSGTDGFSFTLFFWGCSTTGLTGCVSGDWVISEFWE